MLKCFVCSPYGGKAENVEKARAYGRVVAYTGAVPIIPHVMLHGILDDQDPAQRRRGMDLGFELMAACDLMVICGDEITSGMREEIAFWKKRKSGRFLFIKDDTGSGVGFCPLGEQVFE